MWSSSCAVSCCIASFLGSKVNGLYHNQGLTFRLVSMSDHQVNSTLKSLIFLVQCFSYPNFLYFSEQKNSKPTLHA